MVSHDESGLQGQHSNCRRAAGDSLDITPSVSPLRLQGECHGWSKLHLKKPEVMTLPYANTRAGKHIVRPVLPEPLCGPIVTTTKQPPQAAAAGLARQPGCSK